MHTIIFIMLRKLSFAFILFSISMGFSQSFTYKIGLKFESKGKFDQAVKWFLRSEKSIDPNLKQELYLKVYSLAIKLDTGIYGGRAEYLDLAVKFHKKYSKLKSVDSVCIAEQKSTLKNAVKNEIVCLIANKKRSITLYNFYKENSSSVEDELLIILYDLSKLAYKSESDWVLFYESYFNVFQSNKNVDLCTKSRVIFEQLINSHLNESFLTISPDIPRKISDLEYFRMSYGLEIKKEVSDLFASVKEKIQGDDSWLLWKLWNYEKQIYRVNPNLLDKRIFKISYLLQINNNLNYMVLKQHCNEHENICFDSEPFYYEDLVFFKGKTLVLNNQLLQFVFLQNVEDNLHKVRDCITSNPITSVFNSDSAFRAINDIQTLKVHLARNFNHYFDYATTCFEYDEFDKMLFADLLYEIAKERITAYINRKDLSSATAEFLRSVQMFPMRNWKDQKVWFYNYFKKRLNLKETALMGKEIFIATHFFYDDKDFKVLIEQYRDFEFSVTYKNNNIKPDSWTGSTEICECGTMSDEYMKAALESMKFFRRYTGLPDSIYFREKENRDAQCAALIMQAVNDKSKSDKMFLDHHPKSTSACYTAEGYYGASTGNLFYGTAMSGAVVGTYVDDLGQGETGHRAWVFAPDLVSYGFGSTSNANCLVWGGSEQRDDLTNFYKNVPFSWPPAGVVLDDLVNQSDNWTFALQGADFSKANVKVISGKSEIPIIKNYYQGFLAGYGRFCYLNFNFGMVQITEHKKSNGFEFSSTYWRSKAIKGKIYEVFIDNVIDAYGRTRTFKYKVEIK